MTKMPENMHSITPHFMVEGADKAMELYKQAFGAEMIGRIPVPGSDSVMHASFKIGNSVMFISDPVPDLDRKPPSGGVSSTAFYLYVDDVDATFKQAVSAGMKGISDPEDMFWGDRTAVLHDVFGYNWTLATFQRDVSPEEMTEMVASMGSQP